jgi:hypothetical protein
MRLKLPLTALIAASCTDTAQPTNGTQEAQHKTYASQVLISPDSCELITNRLRRCRINPAAHSVPSIDTAVPLRTSIRSQRTGNCSSPYALAVDISVEEGRTERLQYLSSSEIFLRTQSGGATSQIQIQDASPWTQTATFDSSCRISLEIQANEPDIDTREDALGVLAQIEAQLAAARTEHQNYEQLLALQAAYNFTRAIANSFHVELSNETMQALRQAALEAAPAIESAITSCGDALSDGQRETLFSMYVSMVALGDPSSWEHDDGSTRTLDEFYGPAGAEVVARLQELAENADPSLEAVYRQGLELASAEVVRLTAKLALAQLQLAEWLEEST